MGMFWKGCNSRSALSPVTRHEAVADTESSRNISSLGSRQARMWLLISTSLNSCKNLTAISCRASMVKYLSNLGRNNTLSSSLHVSLEYATRPVSSAFFKASALTERGESAALTNTLVSKTKMLGFIQNVGQNIIIKSLVFGILAQSFQEGPKLFFLSIEPKIQQSVYILNVGLLCFFAFHAPPACRFGFNFQYNSFHNNNN